MTETPCPCCGTPMDLEPHRPSTHWTLRQAMQIRRMLGNGIPAKVVARLFEVNPQAIREFSRRTPRIIVPGVAVEVRKSA